MKTSTVLCTCLPFILLIQLSLAGNSQPHFISPSNSYWTGQCTNPSLLQSPISLTPPFTYLQINTTFDFAPFSGGELTNADGFNLEMQGDFGSFIYDGVIFTVYQINFKSPSEHAIGAAATKLPLEMQILAMDQTELQANIAILFSEDEEDGTFLSQFGFGDGILQHLKDNQAYQVPGTIDLSDAMPPSSYFFIYQGSMTTPPCTPALWLVGFETFKVSARQLNDFPKTLLYQDRTVQTQPREVFCNFDPALTNATSATPASPFESELAPPQAQLNSIYKDPFTIIGDDIPYNQQIYPSLNQQPAPRTINNGDYLIVQNPSDPAPYANYLLLDENTLQKAIKEMQNKKGETVQLKNKDDKVAVEEKPQGAKFDKIQEKFFDSLDNKLKTEKAAEKPILIKTDNKMEDTIVKRNVRGRKIDQLGN